MADPHSWVYYALRRLVCVFLGHKPIKWDTSWDNYGSYIVICDRCRKVLEREWGK